MGYTLNRSYGEPRSTQDNATEGISAALRQDWDKGGIDLSYQRSEFTDRTSAGNNLLTHTINASGNWKFGPRLSVTLGEALNITKDPKDGSRLRTSTLSSSFNAALFPQRLTARGSASFTDTEDNDTASRADRQDTNLNLQLTWKALKSLELTAGGFLTEGNDRINHSNNKTTRGVSVRAAYNF